MTIRGGGGARDQRSQAHPLDDGSSQRPPSGPRVGRPERSALRSPYGREPGGGHGQLFRFAVFVLVLAAIVLLSFATILRPLVAATVVDWAYDNPSALKMPFVADLVRENLGTKLSTAPSVDATEVQFTIQSGDTPEDLAPRLLADGFIGDERAFLFEATRRELGDKLDAGNFLLRRNMTPNEVVTGLIENRVVITVVPVNFREGLRLEQITAKIQTLEPPIAIDAQEFYDMVTEPPAELNAEFPWLETARPEGASLEGFLAPATYELRKETTAGDLVRMMLQAFQEQVGEDRLNVPGSRGSFYEVLILASIVEREAQLEEERRLIAGVYQNRLNTRPRILNADPTVLYGIDTLKLRDEIAFEEWRNYTFWTPAGVDLNTVELPEDLASYQTYARAGMPAGPICTPSVASIDAALDPDTESGYFYFVAIPDGGGKHAFAKTKAEHDQNRRKYGYL